ncbi:hypothetical protein [Acinetobacter shaoyimingii]|uniref:Uncharacterized protein n=1 Tax=Acinetobacter shaoyimingii TaxID=2715164 RepID=A0A6G8RY13_9GAMM|nr:hypothetical protein [Acinetobacter shaoyimingii]NHB58706.1 hypothetical protein [Acinetobacter shaoyimingii]QIO06836.1 hypothetical protein G8E00_13245 [Acinetobacter shaoyimingii]
MLDKIQTKIDGLANGKKLILGAGIKDDEMQKVISLCEDLESKGVIKLNKIQKSSSAPGLVQSIIIEKV